MHKEDNSFPVKILRDKYAALYEQIWFLLGPIKIESRFYEELNLLYNLFACNKIKV